MNTVATSLSPEHQRSHREIAAHFAGQITPAREAAMRAHLPGCASCRHHYDRHLILARMDPQARPAVLRIASGLGLRWRAQDGFRWKPKHWIGVALLPIVAAAAFALLIRPAKHAAGTDTTGGFAARGVRPSETRAPTLWTYHLAADGTPKLAGRSIGADDELAFAYSNPQAKPYVMVFGVDEHRRVYWFHPAWLIGAPVPVAIRASAGPGPHELSDAIRHSMDGRKLIVFAVFSDRALDATTVETRVRAAAAVDVLPSLGDGVVVTQHTFEVLR